ncbi:MAG: hypothetical protein NT134_02355 [Chloroflexi bacterium]|nr:hypothetical protein [Chloroflexota bacterium]
MAVRLYGKDPKDVDETISKIMKSVSDDIDTLNLPDNAKQELKERINYIDHKLYVVKYHLKNYEQAESDKIQEFIKKHKPPAGIQMMIEEPRLIYEVESFLFQVKSCLDVLSWVLKPVFGFTYCSFGDKGDDVINQLRNNCPAPLTNYAEKIVQLIEDAQDKWVVELIKMRDDVTHYSRLKGFDCFIEEPYTGGGTANIHYPTMPNKRRALEYCQDVWKKLLNFCEDFLKLTLEAARISR